MKDKQLFEELSLKLQALRARQGMVEEDIEQLAVFIREHEVRAQQDKPVPSKECHKKYKVLTHAYCTKNKKHIGPCGQR
jgi:hypothetical protein